MYQKVAQEQAKKQGQGQQGQGQQGGTGNNEQDDEHVVDADYKVEDDGKSKKKKKQ